MSGQNAFVREGTASDEGRVLVLEAGRLTACGDLPGRLLGGGYRDVNRCGEGGQCHGAETFAIGYQTGRTGRRRNGCALVLFGAGHGNGSCFTVPERHQNLDCLVGDHASLSGTFKRFDPDLRCAAHDPYAAKDHERELKDRRELSRVEFPRAELRVLRHTQAILEK